MSKPANPNELLDRYLQAVRFWLPKRRGQEDLLAELGEDLRSQFEAKEAELGRPLELTEASAILKRCGVPMVVASRLGPKKHLIGPGLYPTYVFVLKMALLWILVPVFVFIVGPVNVANSHGNVGSAIGTTIGDLWPGLFIAAGIITLVFAILERSQAHVEMACKFDPLSLPAVQKTERKPSLATNVCQMVFALFGLLWLLLLPQYPVLILGPAAAFLQAAPVVHSIYGFVVLLAVLSVLQPAIMLANPEWTWVPPLSQLLQTVFSMILAKILINAAAHVPAGDWHPFVVLSDSVKNSAPYLKTVAVLNASILVGLVCAWVGLCIAILVHLWRLMRSLRRRETGTQQPATLHT